MNRYKAVFTTDRGERHQQAALDAAPDILDITMLRRPDGETLQAELADSNYLVSERAGVVSVDTIKAAPRLKLILRLGSLVHDIDAEAARDAGIAVCTWPVRSVIQVAEHVILQMLALTKRVRETQTIALEASSRWGKARRTDEDVFAFNWSRRENIDTLWQKTIGILGFGEIGWELARRLQDWECDLRYNKRTRLPESVEDAFGLTYATVETLFVECDIIANLLPYHDSTDMLIGGGLLATMKNGAYLVSSGSGSVVDESALARAVASGKLGGAALDTFEWEPLQPDNPLLQLATDGRNVLLTPHVAGGTVAEAMVQRVNDYTNILNHINGKPLQYRVA